MKNYEQEINLYFELKGTPKSSQESYFRRMKAFITFIEDQNKSIDEITESDIQQYILYLKKRRSFLLEPLTTIFLASNFYILLF